MLTSTLTLDDASGDATEYVQISLDTSGSVRRNSATTNAEPSTLSIKHSRTGKGVNAVDRHLIQFAKTELDSLGVPRTSIVNLTMAVPQATVVTNQDIFDLVANLVDLVSDGGFTDSGMAGTTILTQILRGES